MNFYQMYSDVFQTYFRGCVPILGNPACPSNITCGEICCQDDELCNIASMDPPEV
mgnify:CR=1 FL=1